MVQVRSKRNNFGASLELVDYRPMNLVSARISLFNNVGIVRNIRDCGTMFIARDNSFRRRTSLDHKISIYFHISRVRFFKAQLPHSLGHFWRDHRFLIRRWATSLVHHVSVMNRSVKVGAVAWISWEHFLRLLSSKCWYKCDFQCGIFGIKSNPQLHHFKLQQPAGKSHSHERTSYRYHVINIHHNVMSPACYAQ